MYRTHNSFGPEVLWIRIKSKMLITPKWTANRKKKLRTDRYAFAKNKLYRESNIGYWFWLATTANLTYLRKIQFKNNGRLFFLLTVGLTYSWWRTRKKNVFLFIFSTTVSVSVFFFGKFIPMRLFKMYVIRSLLIQFWPCTKKTSVNIQVEEISRDGVEQV